MKNVDQIKSKLLERKQELEEALPLVYKERVSDDVVQDSADQSLT